MESGDGFRGFDPIEPHQLAVTPTGGGEPDVADVEIAAAIEGKRGTYRIAWRAMEIPGFEPVVMDDLRLVQLEGPLLTQRTHIRQMPGASPVFYKRMEHVAIGVGFILTVCTIDVTVPIDVMRALDQWRDRAVAAVGAAAAILDERLAQEQVAEDLLVFDEDSAEPIAVVDYVLRERRFPPTTGYLQQHSEELARLAHHDFAADDPVNAATRWYLRGAQLGPVADAVVYLWIALEALARPAFGTRLHGAERTRPDSKWVELAVEEAGLDPGDVEPSIGRLAGLRAEIVHGGVEQPALLREGYYALEQLVRLLLRTKLGVTYAWPINPGVTNLIEPFKAEADEAMAHPETVWWEIDGAEVEPPAA